MAKPETIIAVSWKSSSPCLALNCACGARGHHHDYFGYSLMCEGCGRTYRLAGRIAFTEIELHDPDCPMTNSDEESRTVCTCDGSMYFAEDGSHRTVPFGGDGMDGPGLTLVSDQTYADADFGEFNQMGRPWSKAHAIWEAARARREGES